ncbi:hypothetical protein [Staphylococcus kloosii]|uniref:Uncharacterized protein n=1 Tax=Staphylococcus kloosii TaxID=29384 RepID=A0A151A6A8_9STAP|nr:hypothetical protein [Staphylococcus kloosii]KYH14892.1 hypothetical protein A0131_08900 [Staphylococcus kloosii]
MEYIIKDKQKNNYYVSFSGDLEQFGDYLRHESCNGEFIKCKNEDDRKVLVRASEIVRATQFTNEESEMFKANQMMREAKEIMNKWN